MRILQIFNRFPWPLKDGGAIANYNESMGYLKAGVSLSMASLNTSKHFVNLEDIPEELRNHAQIYLSYIDNRIKPKDAFLNLFQNTSYHVERFVSKEFEMLLKDICSKNTFDVVVFESVFVAPYLAVIRANSNAVCVLRQHNIEYKIWENLAAHCTNVMKRSYLRLLAARLKKYEVSVLNSFNGITVFTKTDLDMLQADHCAIPIGIFPFGIQADALIINQENLEMPSLFHLGSMDWLPNQEAMTWFIQEVWFDVSARFPSLHFYLAGRNIPVDFFDYNNQNNIRVLGEVENAHELMNNKAIMIVPLFSGSGIRIKILEGMALGKCIIATNLGAQGIEAVAGKDILFANTAEEFKNQIAYLIENPTEITRIGNNAKDLARTQYNNTLLIQQKLNFYNQLAKAQ